ncbi:MAG: hypothetical protein U5R31_17890 [Acidimicrobiia bacterium]|nr:hypothetical protein [Acidimicrobiia bacterium]
MARGGAVLDALERHGLDRVAGRCRPTCSVRHPTTDGGFFHTEGVPIVQYLTAPMYLFDSADTLDKVHAPSLDAVTAATVDLVTATGEQTAAALRASIHQP